MLMLHGNNTMSTVFAVYHVRAKDPDNDDVKSIGIFSSRKLAEAAIDRVKVQAGFRDYLDDFLIDEKTIDKVCWTEGFVSFAEVMEGVD
jgi:hypothetical protein